MTDLRVLGVRQEGLAAVGPIGDAECMLVSSRVLVDWAEAFLFDVLHPASPS